MHAVFVGVLVSLETFFIQLQKFVSSNVQVMGILVLVSAWYQFFYGHSGMTPCAEHHTSVFTH
jgi:hypothetical protein